MRPLPLLIVLALTGCDSSSATVWVRNGLDEPLRVEGLDDPATVEPGQVAPVGRSKRTRTLIAHGKSTERGRVELPAGAPRGALLWDVGGGGCFAEGDYSAFYADAAEPAYVELMGTKQAAAPLYVSEGRVDSGPGERLPARQRADTVRALVQVPCDAVQHDNLARAWLDMKLPDVEPRP